MKQLLFMGILVGILNAQCEIEAWNYKQFTLDKIKVDGTTTCQSGILTLKLFDSDDKYIANKTTYIRAGTFKAYVDGVAPAEIKIKYSISQ
jgi:hypothetical protein